MNKILIVNGYISSKFGYRIDPIDKKTTKLHNGIDIAAKIGAAIKAPLDLIVVDVYEHDAGGLTIVLADVKKTIRIAMCHLSKINVKINQIVKKGQTVALVGETGTATGPHLHISLKKNGLWTNKNYNNGCFVDPTEIIYL